MKLHRNWFTVERSIFDFTFSFSFSHVCNFVQLPFHWLNLSSISHLWETWRQTWDMNKDQEKTIARQVSNVKKFSVFCLTFWRVCILAAILILPQKLQKISWHVKHLNIFDLIFYIQSTLLISMLTFFYLI